MIQIPVTIDAANRKKDKSVSIRFTSSFEMNTPDFAEIDRHIGNAGWLLFRSNKSFESNEVPKEDAPEDGKKPSQRLRGVIYKVWELNTDQSEDFDQFYKRHLEKIIQQYKDKLPDAN